jgi:hypothetical protein
MKDLSPSHQSPDENSVRARMPGSSTAPSLSGTTRTCVSSSTERCRSRWTTERHVAARIRTSVGPTPAVLSRFPLTAWVRRRETQGIVCRSCDRDAATRIRTWAGPAPTALNRLPLTTWVWRLTTFRGQDSNLRTSTVRVLSPLPLATWLPRIMLTPGAGFEPTTGVA